MDDPNWRDQFLSDIIEAQVVLLGHFTATLEAAGLTTREDTAGLLRAVADNQDLRQGVQVCLRLRPGRSAWCSAGRSAARPIWCPPSTR